MSKVNAAVFGNSESYSKPKTIEYHRARVEVKPALSYPEMLAFVDFVVDACFDKEMGTYRPELCDFAIRYAVIEMYTNIELPEDDSDRYDIVYGNEELFHKIIGVINDAQFNAMADAIDKKIDALVEANANEILQNMNALYNTVIGLVDMFNKQFEGIDEDDLKKMVNAIANSNLDETKFVESYMDNKNK